MSFDHSCLPNLELYEAVSDSIWDFAELKFGEHKSMSIQVECLKQLGFRITTPIAGLETAFLAEYGSGLPVIAILGEYDALEGLSQVSGSTVKQPLEEQTSGHGCGHHLLGTGAVEAAALVKDWLLKSGVDGTIRYYGCPAEEGGSGKITMVNAGVFCDVDVALSWHPQSRSFLIQGSTGSANFTYRFHGKAAHAATNPSMGRSALEAAELMNIGVSFLRQHLPADVSIQYAFRDAGGHATNIIPDHAAVAYTIRSSDQRAMEDTFERIQMIAQGAALMAGVTVDDAEIDYIYSPVRKNTAILNLIQQKEQEVGIVHHDDLEISQAKAFCETIGWPEGYPFQSSYMQWDNMKGSTDFGNVSRTVPAGVFAYQTFAAGTPLHSWQATAQGKMSYAHKGMHCAAVILAETAIALLNDPDLVVAAKQEFFEDA